MLVRQYNVRYADGGYHSRISLVNEKTLPISPYTVIFLNSWIPQGTIATKKRIAYELRFFLMYLLNAQPERQISESGISGIDIFQRVLSGQFLTTAEVCEFTEACRFRTVNGKNNKVGFVKTTIGNKALLNAIHSAKASKETISDHTKNGRINTANKFIEFLYEQIHGQYFAPDWVKDNYFNIIHNLNRAVKHKITKQEDPSFEESKIPTEIYLRLLEIIQVDSPNNPFTSSKFRNYLIVQILLETGLRRGAIAKLKISNCKFHGTGDQISVTRTPNDPSDCRVEKPSQKTKSHDAYLPPELMKKIDDYVLGQRARFSASISHEFVFVAEHDSKNTIGKPISLKSINYIFNVLSKALDFNLYPHLGRHKWNEIFTDSTKNISDEQVDKLRKYAMGWSKTSSMVDTYNAFKLSVSVRNIQSDRQSKIMSSGAFSDE